MPDTVASLLVGEDVPTEMVHDTPLGTFIIHVIRVFEQSTSQIIAHFRSVPVFELPL